MSRYILVQENYCLTWKTDPGQIFHESYSLRWESIYCMSANERIKKLKNYNYQGKQRSGRRSEKKVYLVLYSSHQEAPLQAYIMYKIRSAETEHHDCLHDLFSDNLHHHHNHHHPLIPLNWGRLHESYVRSPSSKPKKKN